MIKSALFAGSFDPPTLGHEDIIRRASAFCDKLYVGLAGNTEKKARLFTLDQRCQMLELLTHNLKNVEVVTIPGLVVDFVKSEQVNLLVRSLRSSADVEHEFAMAAANRQMVGVETLFLMADPRYCHLSSTLVREILTLGGSGRGFVPEAILDLLNAKAQRGLNAN